MRKSRVSSVIGALLALWLVPALAADSAPTGEAAAGTEAGAVAAGEASAAGEQSAAGEHHVYDWESLTAGNELRNLASLQRGARNFVNYCLACHSLKYLRYSRLAADLNINDAQLAQFLIPTGDKPTDYILSNMPAADATVWFGKEPPDLSLIARSRSPDYLFRLFKTYYVDRATGTLANNLQLPTIAMPAVLSDLEGTKEAVFRNVETVGEDGKKFVSKVFDHFEMISPGKLSPADYDDFVRDTVNFLDYASDPTQVERRDIGIWVVLFLLVFTWLAWLLKKEYWKDVH